MFKRALRRLRSRKSATFCTPARLNYHYIRVTLKYTDSTCMNSNMSNINSKCNKYISCIESYHIITYVMLCAIKS